MIYPSRYHIEQTVIGLSYFHYKQLFYFYIFSSQPQHKHQMLKQYSMEVNSLSLRRNISKIICFSHILTTRKYFPFYLIQLSIQNKSYRIFIISFIIKLSLSTVQIKNMNLREIILLFTLVVLVFSASSGSAITTEVNYAITDSITSAYYTYGSDPLNNAMGTSQQLSRIYPGLWSVIININGNDDKAFVTPSINGSWWAVYDANYFKFATSYHYYLARIQTKDNAPAKTKGGRGSGIDTNMHNKIMSACAATNSVTLPTSRAAALHKKLMQVLPIPGIYWSVYTANNRNFNCYIGCYKDMWQSDDRVYDGNHHNTIVWAVSV